MKLDMIYVLLSKNTSDSSTSLSIEKKLDLIIDTLNTAKNCNKATPKNEPVNKKNVLNSQNEKEKLNWMDISLKNPIIWKNSHWCMILKKSSHVGTVWNMTITIFRIPFRCIRLGYLFTQPCIAVTIRYYV